MCVQVPMHFVFVHASVCVCTCMCVCTWMCTCICMQVSLGQEAIQETFESEKERDYRVTHNHENND